MSISRRGIADDLCDDAHELLRGAPPATIIARLEYKIQDLQELEDNANKLTDDTKQEDETN